MSLKSDAHRSRFEKTDNRLPPIDKDLYCINPPLLAQAIALLHRDDKNVQDLVIKVYCYF